LSILISNFHAWKGRFKYKPGQARAFGMLAGGSGITPMFQVHMWAFKKQELLFFVFWLLLLLAYGYFIVILFYFLFFFKYLLVSRFSYLLLFLCLFVHLLGLQLIQAILKNPKDKTNVHLIYANVTADDILLKVIWLASLSFMYFKCNFISIKYFTYINESVKILIKFSSSY